MRHAPAGTKPQGSEGYAARQAVSDLKEVQRRRALALQSLGQLEDYAGLARSTAKDIDIFLKGPDVGRQ